MKKTQTNRFQDFIKGVNVTDYNELYELHNAATLKTSQNIFDVAENDLGQLFITHKISNYQLNLLSEKAIVSFIGFIENDFMDGMDGESHWSYKRELDKE